MILLILSLFCVKGKFRIDGEIFEYEICYLFLKFPKNKSEDDDEKNDEDKSDLKGKISKLKSKTKKEDEKSNSENKHKKQKSKKSVNSEKKKEIKTDKENISDDGEGFFKNLLKNKKIFVEIIKNSLRPVKELFLSIRIDLKYFELDVADELPEKCAKKYYEYCAVIFPAFGYIKSIFFCKFGKIKINPDFNGKKTKLHTEFSIKLSGAVLICVVIWILFLTLKFYIITRDEDSIKKYLEKSEEKQMDEKKNNPKKDENDKVSGLMGTTVDKIRQFADVKTIVGDPVKIDDDITVIPISKVSYGVGSGGSDLPVSSGKYFGGGAGAGMSVTPVGFLVVQNGDVKILQLKTENNSTIADSIPGIIDYVSGFVANRKSSKNSDNTSEVKSGGESKKKSRKEKRAEKTTQTAENKKNG